MSVIFAVIAPIFLIIGMGYLSARYQFFSAEQLSGISKFVLRIGLPVMVFNAIATHPIGEVIQTEYLYGYGCASLLSFLIGWRVSLLRGVAPVLSVLNGLAMGMANSGFVGYPLLLMASDRSAGIYFAMNVLVENVVIFPLMFILLDLTQGQGKHLGQTLKTIGKNLLKNPLIIAIIAALVFALGGLPLPQFLARLSGLIAPAASPLALLIIGSGLYGLRLQGNIRDVIWVTAGKLLVFPILVCTGLWLAGADHKALFAGALFAATPIASMYGLFGVHYGFSRQTSAGMMAATILSVFPIALVLLFGHGF